MLVSFVFIFASLLLLGLNSASVATTVCKSSENQGKIRSIFPNRSIYHYHILKLTEIPVSFPEARKNLWKMYILHIEVHFVGRLWRTSHITIDTSVICWNGNKWPCIMEFCPTKNVPFCSNTNRCDFFFLSKHNITLGVGKLYGFIDKRAFRQKQLVSVTKAAT